MDETLIHCVDDVETDNPDVVLEIDFPDEETVYVTFSFFNIIGWHQHQALCHGVLGGSQLELLGHSLHS